MKENYLSKKMTTLFVLGFLSIHLSNFAQSKREYRLANPAISQQFSVPSVSKTVASPNNGLSTTTITACNSYTWAANGQTYTSSGTYTAPGGMSQSFNTQANWNTAMTADGATSANNPLTGFPTTPPATVTVGAVSVGLSASGGMYSSGTFIGTNTPNDPLTLAFTPSVYAVSANYFVTNITDAVIAGDITITYYNGTTSLFTETRTGIASNSIAFGYSSTTPITSAVITVAATTPVVNRYICLRNLYVGTNPSPNTLNLTIEAGPITTNYSVCQGSSVSGGLTSTLGGSALPVPNFSGDITGGPTYNRPLTMLQGGTCGNSAVGTAVHYAAHTFTAPTTGSYTFSLCGNSTWDTFLALYSGTFTPSGACAGNTLVAGNDDSCGSQSLITVNLVQGTSYTAVVAGFGNTDVGTYVITSTSPTGGASVEWYAASTGGTAIGTGSPFNPVGVAGSGLTDTNTLATTPFYAQFPGGTCRTPVNFIVTTNTSTAVTGSATQTFTAGATVANIVVSPTSVTWYATLANAQAGTNSIPTTTPLVNGSTYYAVNVSGSCSSVPFGVTTTVTLGIGSFDDLKFHYFPNPTSSILTLSYSKTISNLSVTNLLGQNVMNKKTNSTEVQIDLSSLTNATYFIKVTTEDHEKTIKIIKQ